jgi:hypothetical protein
LEEGHTDDWPSKTLSDYVKFRQKITVKYFSSSFRSTFLRLR